MSEAIYVRLTTARTLRPIIAFILLVLADRTFNADAQTETNLHSFVGSPDDGGGIFGGLVQGSDGNFYGMTFGGGMYVGGTVFRISPSGSETILYSFGGSQNDGFYPIAGLVQGTDGNFYGTTGYGGGTSKTCDLGCGTVFRIGPSGSYTNFHSFGTISNDGRQPHTGLVQGSDGNLYGTTSAGGANSRGTVFRINPSGIYTTVYSFVGYPNDGSSPFAGLVQGSDGNLYGTTYLGGTHNTGTVFRMSPSGSYTTLYSFVGYPTDGAYPWAALVQGSDGNLYGTTHEGGTRNTGTVFRISPSGCYTSLYSFVGYPNDGAKPVAGLVQGSDGNLYGTTELGGTYNTGTVFRISPSGCYTTLYSFAGYPTDGADIWAALVQGSDGNFYGTAAGGGTMSQGCTVFRLSVPLNPPANQISGIQLLGTSIVFSIPSVAGETYQLQSTTDLTSGNWSNIPGACVSNSIGGMLTLTNYFDASKSRGVYRFTITP